MMVDVGSEKGVIDSEEKEFIQNVFEFDDITAGEIATPSIPYAMTLQTILLAFSMPRIISDWKTRARIM